MSRAVHRLSQNGPYHLRPNPAHPSLRHIWEGATRKGRSLPSCLAPCLNFISLPLWVARAVRLGMVRSRHFGDLFVDVVPHGKFCRGGLASRTTTDSQPQTDPNSRLAFTVRSTSRILTTSTRSCSWHPLTPWVSGSSSSSSSWRTGEPLGYVIRSRNIHRGVCMIQCWIDVARPYDVTYAYDNHSDSSDMIRKDAGMC